MRVKIRDIETAIMGGAIYSKEVIDTFANKEVNFIRNEGCFSLVEIDGKQAWIDRADIEEQRITNDKITM